MWDGARPPHAYVPGTTARHPDGWFDAIKASVTTDIAPRLLDQTEAWQAGMIFLEEGYFWECHEVLEAVWLQTPQGTVEREMTQAVIQIANAELKIKMGKPKAALRICAMVEGHLARCTGPETILGLSVRTMAKRVNNIRLCSDGEI